MGAPRTRAVPPGLPRPLTMRKAKAMLRSKFFLATTLAIAAAIAPLGVPQAAAAAARCDAAAVSATMQAVRIHEYGGTDVLKLETVPTPKPDAGEVLIEVRGASVNPIDWKLRQGMMKSGWPLDFPAVLGRDLAGVVVGVGAGVTAWRCGDDVVAYLDRTVHGAYAEFVPTRVEDVAAKPAELSYEEAAAYPLVAVTAWRSLVSAGRLAAGERVLIHGGAGGVGTMAVQIAKARGAYVVTTASRRNHEFLQSLGADEVIDYKTTRYEDAVRDMDLVLDAVGGDTPTRSVATLREGGRLISIAARIPAAICDGERIACPAEPAVDNREVLASLATLIEAGKLAVHIDARFPLAEAAAAQALNRGGHTRGKIVLIPPRAAAAAKAKP